MGHDIFFFFFLEFFFLEFFLWESMGLFISGGTKNTTDIMWGCIGGQKMTVMFAHRLG